MSEEDAFRTVLAVVFVAMLAVWARNLLGEFPSATQAASCAVEIQPPGPSKIASEIQKDYIRPSVT
jgi:hypothetical protein